MSLDPVEFQQASMDAATTVNQFGIVGQQESHKMLIERAASTMGGFTVKFERSFNVECSLSVDFQRTGESAGRGHYRLVGRVTVGWPSLNDDPLTCMAALALYQEVVNLAALLRVQLGREVISDKLMGKE